MWNDLKLVPKQARFLFTFRGLFALELEILQCYNSDPFPHYTNYVMSSAACAANDVKQ